MRRITVAGTLLAVMLWPEAPARAWNDTGHIVVALIAYRQLAEQSPATRQRVVALLRQQPDYPTSWRSQMPPDHPDPDAYLVLRAATWPDEIRDPCHPMHDRHVAERHFIDLAYVPAA